MQKETCEYKRITRIRCVKCDETKLTCQKGTGKITTLLPQISVSEAPAKHATAALASLSEHYIDSCRYPKIETQEFALL